MTKSRNFPRFKSRERIGIFSIEDNKLINETETLDISIKGVRFESEASLDINAKYLMDLGYQRAKKLKVQIQIIAHYFKDTKHCFSAIFVEMDLLNKNKLRSYVEAVRAGKSW